MNNFQNMKTGGANLKNSYSPDALKMALEKKREKLSMTAGNMPNPAGNAMLDKAHHALMAPAKKHLGIRKYGV